MFTSSCPHLSKNRGGCHGNEAMGMYAGGGYGSRGPEGGCHGNEAMGIYAGGGYGSTDPEKPTTSPTKNFDFHVALRCGVQSAGCCSSLLCFLQVTDFSVQHSDRGVPLVALAHRPRLETKIILSRIRSVARFLSHRTFTTVAFGCFRREAMRARCGGQCT